MAPFDAKAMEAELGKLLEKHKVAGVQVSVLLPGGEAADICVGAANKAANEPVEPGTIFEVASLSKTVAAAFALEFFAAKGIPMTTPVNTVLEKHCKTDFRIRSAPDCDPSWAQELQLVHLIDHSGLGQHYVNGVSRKEPMPDVGDLVKGRRSADLGYNEIMVHKRPATKFGYSGGGFLVLQHIIETMEGIDADKATRDFRARIGMSEFSFSQEDIPGRKYARGYFADGSEVDGGRMMFPGFAAGGLAPGRTFTALFKAVLASMGGKGPLRPGVAEALVDASAPDIGAIEFMGAKMARGAFIATAGSNKIAAHQAANEGFRGVYLYCISGPNKGSGFIVLSNGDNNAAIFNAEACQVVLRTLAWQGVSQEGLKVPAEFAFEGVPQEEIVNQVYKKLVFSAFQPASRL